MKYSSLILFAVLLTMFAACDITGKSIEPLGGNPGFYFDGAGPRVNFVGQAIGPVSVQVGAADYENISGFEFDLLFSGATVQSVTYGGVFGPTVGENDDAFCVHYPYATMPSSSPFSGLACAALNGPNTEGVAYLYNFTFLPSGPGTVTLEIDDSSAILADDNANSLTLNQDTSGVKSIQICLDRDGDDEFSTVACNFGRAIDCNDNLNYINPQMTEICNNVDNNCDGNPRTGAICDPVTPSVVSAAAAGMALGGTPPQVSGTVTFSSVISDESYNNSGALVGENIASVAYYTDITGSGNPTTLIGTDVSGSASSSITYNTLSVPMSEGTHVLRIIATDALTLPSAPRDYSYTVKNSNTCLIQSITWGASSVNEHAPISATIVGNVDCTGTFNLGSTSGSDFRYEECSTGTCTVIPATTIPGFPNIIDFTTSRTAVITGTADNWFVDGNGGNNQIRLVIVDSSGSKYSNVNMAVVNVMPTITLNPNSVDVTTATISGYANDPSTFTLAYSDVSGNLAPFAGVDSNPDPKYYSFSLTDLEPAHNYYYRVTARDLGNLQRVTAEQSFTTNRISADVDNDGDVDVADLLAVVTQFRHEITGPTDDYYYYDINGDGIVNIIDITAVVIAFN